MKSQQFETSKLFSVEANELSLSSRVLLELMGTILARGVPFRFCARGWSMSPFIRDGDVITVSPLLQTRPRVGEVVAFVRPNIGKLVVHRVLARHGTSLLIKGDSDAMRYDELVPPENLLGRVTRVERNGHYIWLGLGPERFLIAWFSRTGLLIPLLTWVVSRLRPLLRWRG